jgi:hypothetical protein
MVASCWLFLYDLYYDARNHEQQLSETFRFLIQNKFDKLGYVVGFYYKNLPILLRTLIFTYTQTNCTSGNVLISV